MSSKEEIEKAKEFLRNIVESQKHLENCKTTNFYKNENNAIETLLQYIEQLETDKQKLIEKLEDDIEYGKKFESHLEPTIPEIRAEYAQEILEILKGENE